MPDLSRQCSTDRIVAKIHDRAKLFEIAVRRALMDITPDLRLVGTNV
jgi:hypothetical protein